MVTSIHVGERVIITEKSLYEHRTGILLIVYPAGMYHEEAIAEIQYTGSNNKGQFLAKEVELLSEYAAQQYIRGE